MQGRTLREERIAKGVKAIDLARRLGVTHSRVSHIEKAEAVSAHMASRYLAALSTFPDVGSTR